MVRVCALPAFWTGILYDEEILDQVSSIIKSWSYDQVKNFYKEVRINGFNSYTPDKENLKNFSKKIIDLSSIDLKKKHRKCWQKLRILFLEPLIEIIKSGESPASKWKKLYLNQWSNNIDMLYTNNYFK